MEDRLNYQNVTATETQSSCNAMPTNANQERDHPSKECCSQQFEANKLTCRDTRETKTHVNQPRTKHTAKTKNMEHTFMLVDKNSGSFLTQLDDNFDLSASSTSKSDFKESGQHFSDYNANYNFTTSVDNCGLNGNAFLNKKTPKLYNECKENDSSKNGLPVVFFGSQRDIVDLYEGTAQKSPKTRLRSSSFVDQFDQNMRVDKNHSDTPKKQDLLLEKSPEELFPFFEDDDSEESLTDFADELFDFITNPDAGNSASWSETPFQERPLLSDDDFQPNFQRSVQVTDLDALLMQQNVQDNLPCEQDCENEPSFTNEVEKDRMNEENEVLTHCNETEINRDCDYDCITEEEMYSQQRKDNETGKKTPTIENNASEFEQDRNEESSEEELEIDTIKLDITPSSTETTSNMEQISFEEEIVAKESPLDQVNIDGLFPQDCEYNDEIISTAAHKNPQSSPNCLVSENITNTKEGNVKPADLKDVWNFLDINEDQIAVSPTEVNRQSDKIVNASDIKTTYLIPNDKRDNFDVSFDLNASSSHANNYTKGDDDRLDVHRHGDIYIKGDDKRDEVSRSAQQESDGGDVYNGIVDTRCIGDGAVDFDGVGVVVDVDDDRGDVDVVSQDDAVSSGSVVGSHGGVLGSNGVGSNDVVGSHGGALGSNGVGSNDVGSDGGVVGSNGAGSSNVVSSSGGFVGSNDVGSSDVVSSSGIVVGGNGGVQANGQFVCNTSDEIENNCKGISITDQGDVSSLAVGVNDINTNVNSGSADASGDYEIGEDDDTKSESGRFDSNRVDVNAEPYGSVIDVTAICSDDINKDDDLDSTDVIVYPDLFVHAMETPNAEARVQGTNDVKTQKENGSDDQETKGVRFQEADCIKVQQSRYAKLKEIPGIDVQGINGTYVQETNDIGDQQMNLAKFQETNGLEAPKGSQVTSHNTPHQICGDFPRDTGQIDDHSSHVVKSVNTYVEITKQNNGNHSQSSVTYVPEGQNHSREENDFSSDKDKKQSQFSVVELQPKSNDSNSNVAYAMAIDKEQHSDHSVKAVESIGKRHSKTKQSKTDQNTDNIYDLINEVNNKKKQTQENDQVDIKSKHIEPSKCRTTSGSDIIITVDYIDDGDDDKSRTVNKDTLVSATKGKPISNAKSKPAKVSRISSSKAASPGRASNSEKTSRRSRKSRGSDSEHLRNLKSTKLTEKSLKKHSRHLRNSESQQPSEQPLGEAPESPRSSQSELSLDERILNVNRSIDWVRKVIMEMRAQDFTLKLQFDGLRQEIRTLKQEFEQFGVNCECYDDEELKRLEKIQKTTNGLKTHANTITTIKEDSGYHSDASSVSDAKDDGKTKATSVTTAKYLYEPIPSFPKVQTLNDSKCVFEIVL